MDTNASVPPKHNAKKSGYKRSGEYRYGYVDIPETYSSFEIKEIDKLNIAKSWNSDQTCGVVLAYVSKDAISMNEMIESFKTDIISTFDNTGVKYVTDTKDVSIDHGKFTGKKFSCISEANLAASAYFFEGSDGYIHIIQTITDTVADSDYILESYSLTDNY